jgi:hypothetical protein
LAEQKVTVEKGLRAAEVASTSAEVYNIHFNQWR